MSISHNKTEIAGNFHLSDDMCRIVDDRYHIVIFSSCRFRSCYPLVIRNRPTTAYSKRIGLHSRLGKHPRPLTWRLARLKIPITRRVRALSRTSHHLDASIKYKSLEKKAKTFTRKGWYTWTSHRQPNGGSQDPRLRESPTFPSPSLPS